MDHTQMLHALQNAIQIDPATTYQDITLLMRRRWWRGSRVNLGARNARERRLGGLVRCGVNVGSEFPVV